MRRLKGLLIPRSYRPTPPLPTALESLAGGTPQGIPFRPSSSRTPSPSHPTSLSIPPASSPQASPSPVYPGAGDPGHHVWEERNCRGRPAREIIAFLLPMFRHIKVQRPLNHRGPIALIMSPTRELAVRTSRECKPFLKALNLRVSIYPTSPDSGLI